MRNKSLVVIGCNDHQIDLIYRAKELGYITHAFAWQIGDKGEKAADFYYPISTRDKQAILAKCKEIKPDGILSMASDLAAVTSGFVANALGCAANSNEAIYCATNKIAFRTRLKMQGIFQPYFIPIGDILPENELKTISYPVVVKPSDRSGYRGITKCFSLRETLRAIQEAKDLSFERKAIVESYIKGKFYSCECISFRGRHHILGMTEREDAELNGRFIGYKKTQRAGVVIDEKVKHVIVQVLDAVGIINGASSVEFYLDQDGQIQIIEMMPSMYGDWISSHLIRDVYGIDFLRMSIDVACGMDINSDYRVPPVCGQESAICVLCKSDYMELKNAEWTITMCDSEEAGLIPEKRTGNIYGQYLLR